MEKCKILFLAANPDQTSRLALDREIREITEKIRLSEYRDSLELASRWAIRPDDLLQSLNECKPTIVHFSGHGSDDNELILQNETGTAQPVSKSVLTELFGVFKGKIRLVVLNACFSRGQAEAIIETIDCAIGMNTVVGDDAAITFAASLYRAIGFGHSIQNAFDQGKLAIRFDQEGERGIRKTERKLTFGNSSDEELGEHLTPELLTRSGLNPDDIFLVTPEKSESAKQEKEQSMTDNSNRSVSIGGNATGNIIQTGNHNRAELHFTQTTLPPRESVDIKAEFASLRELLSQLRSEDRLKITNALDEAQEEIGKSEPRPDEVGKALERALDYAKQADGFVETATKLKTHITNIVSWLGDSWHKLLPLVGLTI